MIDESPSSEQSLLGCFLSANALLRTTVPAVAVTDLEGQRDQAIYREMLRLAEEGQQFNCAFLGELLKSSGHFENGDARTYLVGLTDGVIEGDAGIAAFHARRVIAKAKLRRCLSAAESIQREADELTANPEQLVEKFVARVAELGVSHERGDHCLVAITAEEFLKKEISPREMVLSPFFPQQGLVMVYGPRGVGKSYLGFGIAVAIATGGKFLKWNAPTPRKVLYLDGELPAKTVQERLALIGNGLDLRSLQIITPDLQPVPMPDISRTEGQVLIEPHLSGIDVLILDNLSALCRSGNENEGEGWLPVQSWLLGLRKRGIAVLFFHHGGKSGTQRGTSRREDLLDSVVVLKHPPDYEYSEGLRCEIHFEKTRSMLADEAKPFEATFRNGTWTTRPLDDCTAEKAAELFADGCTVRDVAKELRISPSKAHRLKKKMRVSE